MRALISVVIPTYNRANDLKRALTSVLNQTYSHWECLVVDNHSTDNTDEIIAAFNDSRIKLYKIHNDGIIAKSRNKGIREASGEYIAFLDSDDWWMAEKLEASLVALEQGADVVYHDLYLAKKSNQRCFFKKRRSRHLSWPVFDSLIAHGNGLLNSSVVIRKTLLKEYRGLREEKRLVGFEDFYAWLELAKITNKFKRLSKCYGYYWAGGGNTTTTQRYLACITEFKVDYADAIVRLLQTHHLFWLFYSEGRAYFSLGEYAKAKQSFLKIPLKKMPLLIQVKLLGFIFFLTGKTA